MKRVALAAILLAGCAAAFGAAAGREADVHLRNGRVTRCVVLGYANGKLRVEVAGRARALDLAQVDQVVFGDAVADKTAGKDDTPSRGGPTPPKDDKKGPPGLEDLDDREKDLLARKRRVEHFLETADQRRLMDALGHATGRFKSRLLLKRAEGLMRLVLHSRPKKGPLDRNGRLSLAILKAALTQDLPVGPRLRDQAADSILNGLKRDYPQDTEIAHLTTARLRELIGEWQARAPVIRPGMAGQNVLRLLAAPKRRDVKRPGKKRPRSRLDRLGPPPDPRRPEPPPLD